MASEIMLYWGSGSGPCWRVMMVLAEKGLKYEDKLVSFEKKEHKSDEILKLNPRGQVPTFIHGDLVINESLAICEYLEATFKNQGTVLIPDDVKERAHVLQRTFEALNVQTNVIGELVYYYWRTSEANRSQEEIAKREEGARKELQTWESYFAKMGDKSFAAGKNFSMADCIFFPSFAFLVRMGLDMSRYPKLSAYYNLVAERPSAKASWPPHWQGTEGKPLLKNL